jgi:WD40 repeat protein
VSASNDETIRIWDSDTGKMVLGPLRGHTDYLYNTVFSPDGRCILSASRDGTIRVWNSQSGDMVLGPLGGHTSGVRFAIFSTDRHHILSCSRDSTIFIRDSDTGERVLGSFEGDSAKLSFTDSETAPYIITPPHSIIPAAGTSASSYSFNLDVVNSDDDMWLYADRNRKFLMARYAGQLILTQCYWHDPDAGGVKIINSRYL